MMVRQRNRPIRRAAALVEAAIMFPVFLTLCAGMIDLGLAVVQNNSLAEASRQGARIASLYGSQAPVDGTIATGAAWGPSAYNVPTPPAQPTLNGNSADAIPTAIRSAGALAGLDASKVAIQVQWPAAPGNGSGGNNVLNGDIVQVTVSTTWTPIVFYFFGSTSFKLSATSIMPMAH